MTESSFIVYAGEFLDGFEVQAQSCRDLLHEMQDSESTGSEDDLFLEVYEKSFSAFLNFRASFSDELRIGQTNSAPLIVPNPFKLLELVRAIASKHMQDGPTSMNVLVGKWHELNQAAQKGALPMFPGQGLEETFKWRGAKLGSIIRTAINFESSGDLQKQADSITVNAITTAFTAGIDKYGLGEPGSQIASISTSLIFAWKESSARSGLVSG